MARLLRIAILLVILLTVAQEAWLARSRATTWKDTLFVGLYPISADGSPTSTDYVNRLGVEAFKPIEQYFQEETKRYGIDIWRPISVTLAPPLNELPPTPPRQPDMLDAIIWTLQVRWWAWHHDRIAGPKPNIRLFLLYFDPKQNNVLPHSVGIDRGLIGVINLFAHKAMAGSNNVVIAHEMLHTLGATDKYDPASNHPRYPDGYAEPQRNPLLPQDFAEIMAGRIPISETQADIPEELSLTRVGVETAREIRWKPK